MEKVMKRLEKPKSKAGRKKKSVIKDKIISIRFTEEQLEYIEYLIGFMEQTTGFPTDRAKVIAKALDVGLEALEAKLEKIKL